MCQEIFPLMKNIFVSVSASSLEKNRQSTSSEVLPLPAIDIFQNFLLLFRISFGKYMLKVTIKKLKQINKLRFIGLIRVSL